MKAQALQNLAKLGDLAPVRDPLERLAQLAAEVDGYRAILRGEAAKLSSIGYSHDRAGEQTRATLEAYERALDRSAAVLTSIGRLRIDERMAKVTEEQQQAVVSALEVVVGWLGLTGDRARAARGVLVEALRANDAGRRPVLPPALELVDVVEVVKPCPRCAARDLELLQGERLAIEPAGGRVVDVEPPEPRYPAEEPPGRHGARSGPAGDIDPGEVRRQQEARDVQLGLAQLRNLGRTGGIR